MSSASDIAVSVRGLSKSYTIAHQGEKHVTLAEQLLASARRPFTRAPTETFWALKDVEFDIQKGDVVGIIGRNGAGKSTLLKILSRITEPTTGTIDLYGRVGSLLEVGTGFHPELTGRENVFLNGAILGMTKAEIRKQFDAIVDFAGVEQFLDTPVKRYSSGMYVRLAFAVAAHLESEILILDEVLAVGDSEFQKRCLGKMQDVANCGRTVLFVSHNMQSIRSLCSTAMCFDAGRCVFIGATGSAVERYSNVISRQSSLSSFLERAGTGEIRIVDVKSSKAAFSCAEEKFVRLTIERHKPLLGDFYISCHVVDQRGTLLLQCDSNTVGVAISPSTRQEIELSIRSPWLKPGSYRLDFFLYQAGIIDRCESACSLEVLSDLPYANGGANTGVDRGEIYADYAYRLAI